MVGARFFRARGSVRCRHVGSVFLYPTTLNLQHKPTHTCHINDTEQTSSQLLLQQQQNNSWDKAGKFKVWKTQLVGNFSRKLVADSIPK